MDRVGGEGRGLGVEGDRGSVRSSVMISLGFDPDNTLCTREAGNI